MEASGSTATVQPGPQPLRGLGPLRSPLGSNVQMLRAASSWKARLRLAKDFGSCATGPGPHSNYFSLIQAPQNLCEKQAAATCAFALRRSCWQTLGEDIFKIVVGCL